MAATDPQDLLRKRVMAAVATLLGATSNASAKTAPAEAAGNTPMPNKWTWETSFMQYNEADRIAVSEPQVGVRRDFGDERALTILATIDTISGATPLGTLPLTEATAPNTVTSPSGKAVNSEIGKVPTSHMTDTRFALNTAYERPVRKNTRDIIGGNVSIEHDFLSLGGSYTRNLDFNQKNTTLSLGLSPELDRITPTGGLPLAYATTPAAGEFEDGSKTKYLVGGLIGLTQVINRRTLMQWNYAPTYENGYLNDPYKNLSLTNANGDPTSTIHEKRPGSRLEHSLYWLTRYNIRAEDVFSLGLRYYTDNWGIRSQMIDFTYRWQYHARRFFEPHVRYSHQSAADFFHIGLPDNQPLPDFASADYRLSTIDGVTFGARMGWVLKNRSELILRAEYYIQTGDDRPREAVGEQRAFNLFPTLYASIVQVDYRFEPSRLFAKKKMR